MASPLQFDIPHQLGKDEARRRIQAGIPKLERHIPGGGQVDATWLDEDRVKLAITAMGQKVSADLQIEETSVKASVTVPLMLSMMAGAISGFVKTSAEKMLAAPSDSVSPGSKA
ncbi:polyhydroxyalkanoic acid system family protein [Sphingomonas abietis]|uniref:Polyhydroxyalkanoic acid system family protein n=1 Tax=Sphingomonas abietis TaxID=3012344 RepID=A0ABY7NHJ0_9SPHN|nr:polyhydroxyalkanoic acid system family protein [Sphingomonas abietis]WBO20793.1 polyhydroxyalkanoic acid system family protein [Sphingomonas abietis]